MTEKRGVLIGWIFFLLMIAVLFLFPSIFGILGFYIILVIYWIIAEECKLDDFFTGERRR